MIDKPTLSSEAWSQSAHQRYLFAPEAMIACRVYYGGLFRTILKIGLGKLRGKGTTVLSARGVASLPSTLYSKSMRAGYRKVILIEMVCSGSTSELAPAALSFPPVSRIVCSFDSIALYQLEVASIGGNMPRIFRVALLAEILHEPVLEKEAIGPHKLGNIHDRVEIVAIASEWLRTIPDLPIRDLRSYRKIKLCLLLQRLLLYEPDQFREHSRGKPSRAG